MAGQIVETGFLAKVSGGTGKPPQKPGFWAKVNGRKLVGFRPRRFAKPPRSWLPGLASLALLAAPQPALAQIIPDGSLGTQVGGTCAGEGGTCNITNGSPRGSNLFHSFQRFSLPNSDVANFQTLAAIQNVIVHITGQEATFFPSLTLNFSRFL